MKHLVILGAGGLGRELYNFAKDSKGYSINFDIKGFLDYDLNRLNGFLNYPPILGNDEDYLIENDDVFVSAIGNMSIRQKSCDLLRRRGAIFVNIVHNSSIINSNARLGVGNVIFPYAVIGADAKIGDNNLIQNGAVIGHDAVIGCCTRIDCHVTVVGGVKVGSNVYVYTGAVLSHNVVVEDGASVGANSFVIRRVGKGSTVFGNPAVKLFK